MNHKELLAIRVRPAEFARLLGVSKQTVSTWIRDGKVTINTLDGLLDVRRAIQDVLRNTSPGRLRSRVLRQAVTDALELRENLARAEDRAEAGEAALTDARKRIAYLESFIADLAIGKPVQLDVVSTEQTDAALGKLREIKNLIDFIKDAGPINVNAAAPAGTDATAEALRKAALQYGRRN